MSNIAGDLVQQLYLIVGRTRQILHIFADLIRQNAYTYHKDNCYTHERYINYLHKPILVAKEANIQYMINPIATNINNLYIKTFLFMVVIYAGPYYYQLRPE